MSSKDLVADTYLKLVVAFVLACWIIMGALPLLA
jgi:hypothetical protein